jgi:hypothetical protein
VTFGPDYHRSGSGNIEKNKESAALKGTVIPCLIQCLGGFVMMLLSGGLTAWNWYQALHEGYFYPKASAAGPAFFVLGLAMLFFRSDQIQQVPYSPADEGYVGKKRLTPLGWLIVAVGLAAGLCNCLLMHLGW